jgi:hypothetical protein
MVLIVFLQQEVDVLVNQPFHVPHGVGRNTTVSGQRNRVQPELALSVCTTHVNVRRLGALVRVKVKTITTDPKHRGHPLRILRARDADKFGAGRASR